MPIPGFNETEARAFMERELGRAEASTSFYWESDELEEAVDLLLDVVATAIAANNRKVEEDREREARRARIAGM